MPKLAFGIGYIRILGIGLELAWNGGSCGGISLKRDCGVLWTSGTMNSGHVTERVCVHVCWSGSSKCDFVLLELLALVASRNTTLATRMVQI